MCLALQTAVKHHDIAVTVYLAAHENLLNISVSFGLELSLSLSLSLLPVCLAPLLFLFLCIGFHRPSPCCPLQVSCGTCRHAMPWRCPSSRMPWPCWPTLWSSLTRAGTPPRIHRRTANCTSTPPRSSATPRAVSGQWHCLFLPSALFVMMLPCRQQLWPEALCFQIIHIYGTENIIPPAAAVCSTLVNMMSQKPLEEMPSNLAQMFIWTQGGTD